jgi:hypothetical protein
MTTAASLSTGTETSSRLRSTAWLRSSCSVAARGDFDASRDTPQAESSINAAKTEHSRMESDDLIDAYRT